MLLSATTIFVTKAQIKVLTDNNINIGAPWTTNQTEKFAVVGRSFFIEYPALSGIALGNYQWSSQFNLTSFIPQWGNSTLLGTNGHRFFEGYISHIYYTSLNQLSDRKFKTNIRQMGSFDALNALTRIKCYNYDYTDEAFKNSLPAMKPLLLESGKNQMGVMAQELQEIYPSLVKKDNSTGDLSVNYIGLVPVLIESIKAQQQQIEALKAEIELLKQKRD